MSHGSHYYGRYGRCLAVLEVVQENVETFALNTVLLHDNAAAANNLPGVTLTINLAETSPGSEDLGVSDLDEVDFVFSAERFDELDVFGFCAGLDKDAQMCLALVKSLGALSQTASETIMNKSVLQDLLKGFLHRQFALWCFGGNLDLSGDLDRNVISSVRHLLEL